MHGIALFQVGHILHAGIFAILHNQVFEVLALFQAGVDIIQLGLHIGQHRFAGGVQRGLGGGDGFLVGRFSAFSLVVGILRIGISGQQIVVHLQQDVQNSAVALGHIPAFIAVTLGIELVHGHVALVLLAILLAIFIKHGVNFILGGRIAVGKLLLQAVVFLLKHQVFQQGILAVALGGIVVNGLRTQGIALLLRILSQIIFYIVIQRFFPLCGGLVGKGGLFLIGKLIQASLRNVVLDDLLIEHIVQRVLIIVFLFGIAIIIQQTGDFLHIGKQDLVVAHLRQHRVIRRQICGSGRVGRFRHGRSGRYGRHFGGFLGGLFRGRFSGAFGHNRLDRRLGNGRLIRRPGLHNQQHGSDHDQHRANSKDFVLGFHGSNSLLHFSRQGPYRLILWHIRPAGASVFRVLQKCYKPDTFSCPARFAKRRGIRYNEGALSPRRLSKKARSSRAHSFSSTPPAQGTRWKKAGSCGRSYTLPQQPCRASYAPNTQPSSCAITIAPAHMGQGSSVTYSVQPLSRRVCRARQARSMASISACANGLSCASRSLWALAITCPSRTITAPTGTSLPLCAACARAKRMNCSCIFSPSYYCILA